RVQRTGTPTDANGNPLSGRVIAWVSSNSGIASVNGGLVIGAAAGSAAITASSEGQSGTATITVTNVPVASVSVRPGAATLTMGQTEQPAATPRDAGGSPLAGRMVAG